MQPETLYTIALTRLPYFNLIGLLEVYKRAGSATCIIDNCHNITDLFPDAHPQFIEAMKNIDKALERAEYEAEKIQSMGIKAFCFNDLDYPQRLKECVDAPLVVYYYGNGNLNPRHVLSIVGTRHCTSYGRDRISELLTELKQACPDMLIVSGLAYGVDIAAHRDALENGFETVGVLAHGLDDLYPRLHRDTAARMVQQGGLLTEFPTRTQPVARNFIQRNRIIAGMADATLLVESARKGGGLITCEIAQAYDREVFAFPGNIGAPYSEGCNRLIQKNAAALLTSASDLLQMMNWENDLRLAEAKKRGIERSLFPDLSPEETTIIHALKKNNDLQINLLSAKTTIPISQLSALLFELEMKGIVRTLAGGCYHLMA